MRTMYHQLLVLGALASLCSAQNLTSVLAANNSTLSTLTSLVAARPALLATLGSAKNITILAPTNDAFSKLNTTGLSDADITAVLTYHVLSGTYPSSAFTNNSQFLPSLLVSSPYTSLSGGQVVDAKLADSKATLTTGLAQDSTVTTADVKFDGGVIHVIDTVLTIPASVSTTALDLNLTSLYGALNATSLASPVDSLTNLTIFAPNNQAFANIANLVSTLSTEQLVSILSYHVVNGTVGYSTDLKNGSSLATLGGGDVHVTLENGNVYVNSAKVLIPNILVANGVVHVIDNVLNPNNTSANPSATSAAYSGASTATDGAVPFTSGVSATTTVATAAATTTSGASASSTHSTGGAAIQTGAMGVAALFAAGALMVDL
ncbi:hypothetical protein CJF31_00009051 [Rutstroemia sp. NJR-2017a BVV2]|nr:hypothetical protein CJF31_00009051 [Rutstroemia sp. NJR-2017a BVV2]